MRIVLKLTLVAALLCSSASFAAPASESSIRELLAVTQARKLLDGINAQLDAMMDQAVKHSLQDKTPTVKQQQVLDRMRHKTTQIVRDELTWEKLEPLYLRLYTNAFTEDEITGMLTFYKTPAGQAVIHKMPVLMQQTMLEIQRMSAGMAQRIGEVQQQFAAELEAAGQ